MTIAGEVHRVGLSPGFLFVRLLLGLFGDWIELVIGAPLGQSGIIIFTVLTGADDALDLSPANTANYTHFESLIVGYGGLLAKKEMTREGGRGWVCK